MSTVLIVVLIIAVLAVPGAIVRRLKTERLEAEQAAAWQKRTDEIKRRSAWL